MVAVKNAAKLPVEILTADEVQSLLKGCSNRCPTGVRNRALIVCLWRAGLRIGEALALLPKDLNAKAGTLRVLHGKGDKARTVALDPQALAVLQRWLDWRQERLGLTGRQPIFCTLEGGALADAYCRGLFKRLGKKAGIVKRCHPHGLRHTHATELLSEGATMGIISKQLGHTSIATTARYLDHIQPQAVLDFVGGRKW
jgi:site-specific recombinase XerD